MKRPKGYSITSRANHDRWRDDPQWAEMDKWTVTLKNPQGKTLSTQFWKGSGHNGAKPTFEEVVEALISDGQAYDNSADFRDFCAEFGYDLDSDKKDRDRYYKIYKACASMSPKIRAFLGEDYDKLAYDED
jgi:hypothetical protein